jgi:hypothetical protein
MTGNRVKLNNINTVKLISRKLERIARAREKRFNNRETISFVRVSPCFG